MKNITISLEALNTIMLKGFVANGIVTVDQINNAVNNDIATLEIEAGKIPADMMKKLVALEAIVEVTPANEATPFDGLIEKIDQQIELEKASEAKTEGGIKLDKVVNFTKSVVLRGVVALEEEAKGAVNVLVAGGANVIKGGAIQRLSGKATVITGLVSLGTNIVEDTTGINLDAFQSVNDVAFSASSTVFGLSVVGNFVQGARKASDEHTAEVFEKVILSKEEGQSMMDSSIVLKPLDLKF